MKKILMLDLEGVLIATSLKDPTEGNEGYGIRPNAQQFLDEVLPLFDEVYMNTCVREEPALRIMREVFNVENVGYHNWARGSPFQKASYYDQFAGSKLIHVEDGISEKEKQRIDILGFGYVPVRSWGIYEAFVKENAQDDVLLKAIDEIKKKLA